MDKRFLIPVNSTHKYPRYLNNLLFTGTMAACLGVLLCGFALSFTNYHSIWILGALFFFIGILIALVSLTIIVFIVFKSPSTRSVWVQESVLPFEEDFGTDYYFHETRPDTRLAAPFITSNKYIAPKVKEEKIDLPDATKDMYRLVYDLDQFENPPVHRSA